jgi:hypothetical protein
MPDTLTQTPSVSTAYLTELRNQERRQIVSALVELSCGPSNVLDVIADFVIEQKAAAFDVGVKHGWDERSSSDASMVSTVEVIDATKIGTPVEFNATSLGRAYDLINALGGQPRAGNEFEHGYCEAIDDALNVVQTIRGAGP